MGRGECADSTETVARAWNWLFFLNNIIQIDGEGNYVTRGPAVFG